MNKLRTNFPGLSGRVVVVTGAVAEAVLYLLSDCLSWITGATIDINGGFAML